ncbi:uncharacterized protein SCHCODRAFT_02589438 [Schizophyllum commune H4-8]|nr:uncharacterized protein SCHCODRAFT_02589438 [Schizophyllum commune H4-8]KAI5887838.1 hypothetical protein SCHCODRAFT_02589438 [Schizophyllum commune H4-8]
MSHLPPKYLCKRVIHDFGRRHVPNRHYIPPNFFSSKLYRDVLDSLNVSHIPKASASDSAQWLNIVNAADSLRAIAYLMEAGQPSGPQETSEACKRIVADSLSSVWAWSQYMHPFLRNCDEDAFEAATKLYQWQFHDLGRSWHYDALCDVISALWQSTAADSKDHPVKTMPGSASYIYDLWWYMAHATSDQARQAALISTLAMSAFDDPDRHVAKAIVAKGSFGVDPLVRRLCALLDANNGQCNTRAVYPFAYILNNCAICDMSVRPRMYPLIWRVCSMLRLVDYSMGNHDVLSKEGMFLMTYSVDCLHLLPLLSCTLRGPRDIIRLIRQGILQVIHRYLDRFNDAWQEKSVAAEIVDGIIIPAINIPSVATAVDDVLQEDGLVLDPGRVDYDPFNKLRASLQKMADMKATYKAGRKSAMQSCHNKACANEVYGKLKRCPCRWACYCSLACQASDWSSHRTACQTKTHEPDASAFRIDRPSDIRFLQFYAHRLLVARGDSSSMGTESFEVDLTSVSKEPVITVVSDSDSAGERTVSVIVGTWTTKTSLVFPLPTATSR